jgi:hypothetical protein
MAGRSGGHRPRNKIDPSVHVLRGTFRPARHGAALDAQQPVWAPADAQLAVLGPEGQALVARLRGIYELTPWEGELTLEAAVATDRLAEIRQTRPGCDLKARLALDKTEQVWQQQLAALLLALRVRP